MSLKIIKAGILDTVQDAGRFGYQHTGINPGGAVDRYAAQLAHCLLGKDMASPVLELHFPAAILLFQQPALVCITGGDFTPAINGNPVCINQPFVVNKNTVLQFQRWKWGTRCYLSFFPELKIEKWLMSFSTNLKAAAGGWQGRALQKGDVLQFNNQLELCTILKDKEFVMLPWKVPTKIETKPCTIECIIGHEWNNLLDASKKVFQEELFQITSQSDRMGYRLKGNDLQLKEPLQLVSSGVKHGTIQLLPSGQLIILMADHQTTGGYPRIAHVISADLPALAQIPIQSTIRFHLTDLQTAEQKLLQQHKKLQHIQTASKFNIEKWLPNGFRS